MICIACEQHAYKLKVVNRFQLWRCEDCGLEFCHPMPVDGLLKSFYESYRDPLESEGAHALRAQAAVAFLRDEVQLPEGNRVLDYGCGRNLFAPFARANYQAVGYDPYSAEADLGTLDSERFDWIYSWGVLEHETNPLAMLREVRNHLIDGGYAYLTTISTEANIPYRHKPPEHLCYFTKASIVALLRRAELKLLEYGPYRKTEDSNVYLRTLLRSVEKEHQDRIHHDMPRYVNVPTNEVSILVQR